VQSITPYYGAKGYGKYESGLVSGSAYSRIGALIGKIDNNGTFLIENSLYFIPVSSGELLLQMNDEPGTFGNNDGFIEVQIEVRSVD
jgi:hypothetical protein